MHGTLIQVNISAGGMPKLPVSRVMVTRDGPEGDSRRKQAHAGPDRAVSLFSEELYAWLREEGIDLKFGQFGENFTTRGVDLMALAVGDRLRVGECTIQITKPRTPCSQLAAWHPGLEQMVRGKAGLKARVLVEGVVRPGDSMEVLQDDGSGGAT